MHTAPFIRACFGDRRTNIAPALVIGVCFRRRRSNVNVKLPRPREYEATLLPEAEDGTTRQRGIFLCLLSYAGYCVKGAARKYRETGAVFCGQFTSA
jgi:hypothetical protein